MKKTLAFFVALVLALTCFAACEEGELGGDVVNNSNVPNTSALVSGDSTAADSSVADSTSADSSVVDSSVVDTPVEDSSVADTSDVAGGTIVGSWEMKMDIASMLSDVLELGDAGATLSPVVVKQTFTFEKDGIVKFNNNIDSLESDFDNLLKGISGIMATVMGGNADEFYNEMKDDINFEDFKADFPSGTATYTLSDNIVFITTVEDDGEKDVEKYTYSYSDGTLTLTDEDGEKLEFTKA